MNMYEAAIAIDTIILPCTCRQINSGEDKNNSRDARGMKTNAKREIMV